MDTCPDQCSYYNTIQLLQWKKQVWKWFQSTLPYQLLSYLLGDKDLSLLGVNHLWCVANEYSKGKLGAEEKAAFFFKYLFVYPFRVKNTKDALYPSQWQKQYCM